MVETNVKGTDMLTFLGGTISEVDEGFAQCILPISDKVTQPAKVYHAGALLTLADEMASTAINGSADFSKTKLFPYCIGLTANFMDNDPIGPMICTSRVVKRGSGDKSLCIVDTKITIRHDRPAALIRSTHMLREDRPHGKA